MIIPLAVKAMAVVSVATARAAVGHVANVVNAVMHRRVVVAMTMAANLNVPSANVVHVAINQPVTDRHVPTNRVLTDHRAANLLMVIKSLPARTKANLNACPKFCSKPLSVSR